MKHVKSLAGALVVLALVTGCMAAEGSGSGDEDHGELATGVFAVEGMTCGGCEAGVELKVGGLEGVEAVEASYAEGRATVSYDPERVTPEEIIAAIEELGYSAEVVPDSESAEARESGSDGSNASLPRA